MQKIINIVLGLGLIVAIALPLSKSESLAESNNTIPADSSSTPMASNSSGLSLAYIDTDSVWEKYAKVADMKDDLVKEKLQSEGRYNSALKTLEQEFEGFRARARFQTDQQNQVQQQEFMQKEQNLMLLQEELSMKLAQSEQLKNQEITEDVKAVCDSLAKEMGYDFVLVYSSAMSGDVLVANNTSLNVTNKVVERLNSNYTNAKDNN